MKIRFWQNHISLHQSEVLCSLASIANVEVSIVVSGELSIHRIRHGWREPKLTKVAVERGITSSKLTDLFCDKQDVEIFSAPWGNSSLRSAFRTAMSRSITSALMSEPYDWRGMVGYLRVLRGCMHEKLYQKKLAFVLAIGTLAEEWFLKCGYPIHKIYPYAYTTAIKNRSVSENDRPCVKRILYVGQLISRKGVGRLLEALGRLKGYNWQLEIIGTGPLEWYFHKMAEVYSVSERVRFTGRVENARIHEYIQNSDVLVLPSYWDGWGAVVNESLHHGVPVICSNHCGAQCLIDKRTEGLVFESASFDALKASLESVLTSPPLSCVERSLIAKQSIRFSGNFVAEYLLRIVRYAVRREGCRPIPPWLRQE